MLFLIVDWRPGFRFSAATFRQCFAFGSQYTLKNILQHIEEIFGHDELSLARTLGQISGNNDQIGLNLLEHIQKWLDPFTIEPAKMDIGYVDKGFHKYRACIITQKRVVYRKNIGNNKN